MVKTGLFKASNSLIPLDEHFATFLGNGYSLKDKNEAKNDKTEHEMEKREKVKLSPLKNGGRVIYYEPMGRNSSSIIEYFEVDDRFCIYLEYVHPGSINKYKQSVKKCKRSSKTQEEDNVEEAASSESQMRSILQGR
ncbi:hypothetical protein Tco_0977516 [Tanacetum coccineum]|uniref:Uncharacterized protein n=1 Tax=Tanacetum coccineum TaxID=301880 RepID=A0ABQ5EKJ7_9ASTR